MTGLSEASEPHEDAQVAKSTPVLGESQVGETCVKAKVQELPNSNGPVCESAHAPEINGNGGDSCADVEVGFEAEVGKEGTVLSKMRPDTTDSGSVHSDDTNNRAITSEQHGVQGGSDHCTSDEEEDDPFAGLDAVATMDLYDISHYTFGKKNDESKSKAMRDLPKAEVLEGLRKNYLGLGMRRSVGAVILLHSHKFPHVLLLQRCDGRGEYALPGGRLRPGESDEDGLRRKLRSKLTPSGSSEESKQEELDVGEKCTISYQTFTKVLAYLRPAARLCLSYEFLLTYQSIFCLGNSVQLVRD